MSASALAQAGAILAAAGLGALVLVRPRLVRLAGLAAWAAGLGLCIPLLLPESIGRGELLGGGLVGAGAAVVLAVLFQRFPWALAFLALATLPVRIPFTLGGESANLLVPLYVVLGGAALAFAVGLLREPGRRERELGALAWPLALLVGWTAASVLWTADVREGVVSLFFFVLPFAFLALALARLPWSGRALAWSAGLLLALAAVFAAVGIWQWLARDIWWNPKVIVGNAYAAFFRVNSVFWDPSMYGRFLVVAILVAVVLLLFPAGRERLADAGLGALALLAWAGLFLSYSQSSLAALAAGLVLAAGLAWRWRAAAAVAVVAAVMVPVGFAAPQLASVRDSLGSPGGRLGDLTSGRSDLVENGVRIALEHPVAGVGVGGFTAAYVEWVGREEAPPTAASHTTPLTVAAETGLVGLALFAWLLAAAFLAALRGNGTVTTAPQRAAVAAGVALAAIAVHSLFYNAFFEDPTTWALLALVALADRARRMTAA